MKKQSPSLVVDNTLRLLEQRLKSYGVTIHIVRSAPLDDVLLDAGQFKEALANIIINACEAMQKKGNITISSMPAKPCKRKAISPLPKPWTALTNPRTLR
jgi:signal transduction histidine kinase